MKLIWIMKERDEWVELNGVRIEQTSEGVKVYLLSPRAGEMVKVSGELFNNRKV